MFDQIENIKKELDAFTSDVNDEIERFRINLLGKKGKITNLFLLFRDVHPSDKKEFGKQLNNLKASAQEKITTLKSQCIKSTTKTTQDLTIPGQPLNIGSRHPITIIRDRIINIFSQIGFSVSKGPEIEDDWHNFSALNFPKEHPARDMQDTFFINKNMSLRTHTSSVQVRVMEKTKPPIRTISPGRVYRNEAISSRAHCFFHQVEGLYIDENVSFADMKQTLLYFTRAMFGENTEIRLRPSYFPFTEPSAELDVSCSICKSKGCSVCKYSGWLEIMGCGMVDPKVLDNCGLDPKRFSGYAFGMGIERIAQLIYEVNDLRLYSENDFRFLKQFTSER